MITIILYLFRKYFFFVLCSHAKIESTILALISYPLKFHTKGFFGVDYQTMLSVNIVIRFIHFKPQLPTECIDIIFYRPFQLTNQTLEYLIYFIQFYDMSQ